MRHSRVQLSEWLRGSFVGIAGSSRKEWRYQNCGDSAFALELLRLEEHAFKILGRAQTAAYRAALSLNMFAVNVRDLALAGSEWQRILQRCLRLHLGLLPSFHSFNSQQVPRAFGGEGKLTKGF